jgi:hypothetical protein
MGRCFQDGDWTGIDALGLAWLGNEENGSCSDSSQRNMRKKCIPAYSGEDCSRLERITPPGRAVAGGDAMMLKDDQGLSNHHRNPIYRGPQAPGPRLESICYLSIVAKCGLEHTRGSNHSLALSTLHSDLTPITSKRIDAFEIPAREPLALGQRYPP